MKHSFLILSLVLSGCVNLEFPGLIADTAKVSKDAYGAIVGEKEVAMKKEAQEPAKPAVAPSEYITNAYIGQESQSIAEIKQQCVKEAVEKLYKVAGNEVRYIVVENIIATINNSVVANCKLAIVKMATDAPAEKIVQNQR